MRIWLRFSERINCSNRTLCRDYYLKNVIREKSKTEKTLKLLSVGTNSEFTEQQKSLITCFHQLEQVDLAIYLHP